MKLQINIWTYFGRVWGNASRRIGIDSHVMALAVGISGNIAVGHSEVHAVSARRIIMVRGVLVSAITTIAEIPIPRSVWFLSSGCGIIEACVAIVAEADISKPKVSDEGSMDFIWTGVIVTL